MFRVDHLTSEIDALQSSKSNLVLLSGVPSYLQKYVARSFSTTLEARTRFYLLNKLSDIEDLAESLAAVRTKDLLVQKEATFSPADLDSLGLKRVERTWEEGDYSWHGDVVMIWPIGFTNLIRVSLFGDQVEEIALVGAEDRRKLQELDKIDISSTSRGDMDNSSSVPWEVIVEGLNYPKSIDLNFCIVENKNRFDFDGLKYPILDLGLKNIPLISHFDKSNEILENIVSKYLLDKYSIIVVDESISRYHELNNWIKKSSTFQKLGGDEMSLFNKGFIDTINREVILTPYEVFGEIDLLDTELMSGSDDDESKLTRERKILNSGEGVFKKLLPGDLVVHQDHGVGKYSGFVEREEGVFLELQYAGKDKLFVPPSQASKLTKYVGAGNIPPLTSLNSGAWRRIRRKAEEDAEKLAKELLRLYAIRSTVRLERTYDGQVDEKLNKFIDSFEFSDTEDQLVATDQIVEDMRKYQPMDRLLIGDVGFGKTEVAMRAMYLAYLQGYQVAFLAPTTILVEQHRALLERRFQPFGVKVESVSRFHSSLELKQIVESLKKGEIDILVGTHSLLGEGITFKNLGLLVIDEEQKFGVKQKEKIKAKRVDAHVLSMSATPIPRTLNMALSGIRDISMISTPPHGRKPILNRFHKFNWRIVNEAISQELERDGQVYFLHNRVRDINEYAEKIQRYFPEHLVGVAHGQLDEVELSRIMRDFGERDIDILVCSTIIENGIDLPNVNTLIVNMAERFGLAQLYQIRGRIGRTDKQAYAYFMHRTLGGDATARLEALSEASDLGSGMLISSRDMEIRGAGEILGREQSGSISSVGYGMFMGLLREQIDGLKES